MVALAEVYRSLTSPRTGYVRQVFELPRLYGGTSIFVSSAFCNDPRVFEQLESRTLGQTMMVGGAGLSREECLWASLGEAIERCAAMVNPIAIEPARYLRGAFQDLKDRAVDPSRFILLSDEQYADTACRYRPPRQDVSRYWTWAVNPRSGERALVPAFLVWIWSRVEDREEVLAQSVSSGLACGQTSAQAQLSGTLEVIERDAFMTMWLLRRAPSRIKLTPELLQSLDPALLPLLRPQGLNVTLMDLTTDIGVPVIMAVIRTSDDSRLVVGAAASLDLGRAIRKAVVEAHHCWSWVLQMSPAELPDPAAFTSFEQHVRYHLDARNADDSRFLFGGELVERTVRPVPAGHEQQLAEVLRHLERAGYDAYFVDITPRDVDQLGLIVGRTLIPGLHPLACGTANYALDRRRLTRVAEHFNIDVPEPLNTTPHPFP
jgi:ribosomal protein S12 methylthiotransferase accessory factor